MKKAFAPFILSLLVLASCGAEPATDLPLGEETQAQMEALQAELDKQIESQPFEAAGWEVESVELSFGGRAFGGILKHSGFLEATAQVTPLSADNSDFSQTQILAQVGLASMKTDSEGLTQHLLSPDFFDAQKHPVAAFKSSSISKNEDGSYAVAGELTLKGMTKDITFNPVRLSGRMAEFSYDLDLSQFGVVAADNAKVDRISPIKVVVTFK